MFIYRLFFFYKLIPSLIFMLFLKSTFLYPQNETLNDSSKVQNHTFIDRYKIEKQAKQYGFDTKSWHKFFTIYLNDIKHTSLFSPGQVSLEDFQFVTCIKADSLLLKTYPISSLDFIEFTFKKNTQSNQALIYSFWSYSAGVITSAIEEEGLIESSLLGTVYFLPSLTFAGMFSTNLPDKYQCKRGGYIIKTKKWYSELGLSSGNWPLKIEDPWSGLGEENAHAIGLHYNLGRMYSPFSFACRLYYVPLPNIWSLKDTDFELHFNPLLKIIIKKLSRPYYPNFPCF